jgi:catechol 2,3-dioxygenase-like lactoylglutathione lyase family enzyme
MKTKHPLSIHGMHHISLRVCDMERSLAFYRDVLGFSAKTDFLLDGLRFAMLETGNEVYRAGGGEAADATGRGQRSLVASGSAH